LILYGPFRTTPRDYKHFLMALDKLTKCIEVRAVASVTSKEITHRFGVPNWIITDLGSAFTGADFWDLFQDNLIDVYYSSVAHPRWNS
jgi:hypothetical protein